MQKVILVGNDMNIMVTVDYDMVYRRLFKERIQYPPRETDHRQIGTTTKGHNFYSFSTTTRRIIIGLWDR